MKLLSTTALAFALAVGLASGAVIAPQAAMAKEKAPAAPKLSDAIRKPLSEAQEAMKANNTAVAKAKLDEAATQIKTDDDRFFVNQMGYELAKTTQDGKAQQAAVQGMLQSGRVPAASQPSFYLALGQLAYTNKDYPTAEQAFDQAIKLNAPDPAVYALQAETKYKLQKPAEAVGLVQQVAEAGIAKGTPVPQDWIARGMAIGAQAKLGAPTAKLAQTWLKSYPLQTNWRDAILIYRDTHKGDPDFDVDLMRLQRAAGALRGERDYIELAEATQLRFPNEAKTLIDQGVAAGALAQSRNAKELLAITSAKIAADRKSLSKSAATGRSALGTADAYASYGDYASAEEMYRKALTLGGVDANVVNTRLGALQVAAGQKEEAKKTFATITGPRADLAAFWLILIDHPTTAS